MKISLKDYNNIPIEQYNGIYDVENVATYHYLNGNLHRENAPAVHYTNGNKYWYIYGYLHRLNDPAIELLNGFNAYYIDNKYYHTIDEFNEIAYIYLNNLQLYL